MIPGFQDSIAYLNSEDAIKSIETNPYWPKWNSPWWHLSTLFEMGLANQIPKPIAEKMLAEIKRTHLNYFFQKDAPPDKKPYHEPPCPCALGNIYQILSATGLDVDAALPWARSWFLKYQMPDGGLNCDEDAYHADANASSLVGTIAPLEAILSVKLLTPDEENFLDRGAKCLLDRELRLGSSSKFNAEEKLDEEDWLKAAFPRFYLYDVLRGLTFILKWADRRNKVIPKKSISTIVQHLDNRYPDGQILIERHAYEAISTKLQIKTGDWTRGHPASYFPLLEQVSKIGSHSPYLTSQWNTARNEVKKYFNP